MIGEAARCGSSRGCAMVCHSRKLRPIYDVICRRLAQQYPNTNTDMTAEVVPLQEKVVANIRPTLLVLLGTVGFVLLIACSNVANLMLVRANGKKKETAVRLALGSSRWRLIRQSLVESLLLSLAGAAVATVIAKWGIAGLIASLPEASLPRLDEVGIDKTVLLFTVSDRACHGSGLRSGAGAAGFRDRLTGNAQERRTRLHGGQVGKPHSCPAGDFGSGSRARYC